MTIPELAIYTGVSIRTAQRWASEHGMPVYGTGKNRRIERRDFLAWGCRRATVRDAVTEPLAVHDIIIYHKATLYDLCNS